MSNVISRCARGAIGVLACGAVAALTAMPAATAATTGPDTPRPPSDDVVMQSVVTDEWFDPVLKKTVRTTGKLTVYADEAAQSELNSSDVSADQLAAISTKGEASQLASAGCLTSEYLSNPYAGQQSSAPYNTYATGYAWVERSSGCPSSSWFYITLKQERALGYKPEVDTDNNTAYPGAGRAYASVYYACSGTSYKFYNKSDINPYTTSRVTIC